LPIFIDLLFEPGIGVGVSTSQDDDGVQLQVRLSSPDQRACGIDRDLFQLKPNLKYSLLSWISINFITAPHYSNTIKYHPKFKMNFKVLAFKFRCTKTRLNFGHTWTRIWSIHYGLACFQKNVPVFIPQMHHKYHNMTKLFGEHPTVKT